MTRRFFVTDIFLLQFAFFSLQQSVVSKPMSRVGIPPIPVSENNNQTSRWQSRDDERDITINGAGAAYCISTLNPIPKTHVCDGTFNCRDLSDEYLCTMTHPEMNIWGTMVMNSRPRSLPQNMTFPERDRHRTAQSLRDILSHSQTPESALDFLYRACIPGINNEVLREDGTTASPCDFCKPKEILCSTSISSQDDGVANDQSNKHKMCVSSLEVCDRVQQCPGGEDEMYCEIGMKDRHRSRAEISKKYKSDNGSKVVATCESLRIGIQSFLETVKSKALHPSTGGTINQRSIDLEYKRYRIEHWPGEVHHILLPLFSSKSILLLDTQSSNQSLTMSSLCDHIIDCPGGIDEMVCPRRFYCQSGCPLYVNSSVTSDGVSDCEDGSDEWFEMRQRKWAFASKDRMVKDWYVLAFMWLVGVFAVVGNSMVIVKSLQSLLSLHHIHPCTKLRTLAMSLRLSNRPRLATCKGRFKVQDISRKVKTRSVPNRRTKSIRIWHNVFILNLATADFLMGLYLIILGIVSLSKTSNYWEQDRAWRSSVLCQSLGVIVVLSSQASVLTLVALTTLRLATVVKPLGLRLLKRKKVLAAVCVAIWVVSLLIAIVPVLPGTAYSYVTEAWITLPHVRPPVVNRTTANDILLKTIAFSNTSTKLGFLQNDISWGKLEELFTELFPSYSRWKYFGFYSAHSVCLPKLFVSFGNATWKHTTAFLSLNLSAFMYILVAYLIIYRWSKRSRIIQRNHAERCPESVVQTPAHKTKQLPFISWQKLRKLRKDTRSAKMETSNASKTSIHKRNELQKMQVRIFLLVSTDFICWVPICILGFMHLFAFDISDTAYIVSAVGLLPINIALNPILYSNCLCGIPKLFRCRK